MNGTALIRELRSIRPSIPILLATGYVGNDPALASTRSSADDVLRKPLLANDLAASLARVLLSPR